MAARRRVNDYVCADGILPAGAEILPPRAKIPLSAATPYPAQTKLLPER